MSDRVITQSRQTRETRRKPNLNLNLSVPRCTIVLFTLIVRWLSLIRSDSSNSIKKKGGRERMERENHGEKRGTKGKG